MTEEQYLTILQAIADVQTSLNAVDLRTQAIAHALDAVGIRVPDDEE